ncbi:MAG: tetratricopeptide repeat protein [Kiritimatiellia bacterium]
MPSSLANLLGKGKRRAVFPLLLALAAGCATPPGTRTDGTLLALRPVPAVPEGHLRADRALITAFFEANGIRIDAAQAEQILPDSALPARIDRNALRQIAARHNRLLLVVQADERYLREELARNRPLLILLPPDHRYHPIVHPRIPVAWDLAARRIDLLDGNGEIQSLDEDDFFSRREPLKHAALCLVKPGALKQPTREEKLLLADFWFDQGFYRRATAVYSSLQDEAPAGTADVDALVGRGNVLIRRGRSKEAIPVFRAALALEPDNPKILNNLAYSMLHGGGELLAALRHAHKAARLDPRNPVVLETVGSIHLKLGDPHAAAKILEQAWARALKRPPDIQIAIMDQLTRAWLAADRRDLAWQVAEHRHRSFPEYKLPADILFSFPVLRQPPAPIGKKQEK